MTKTIPASEYEAAQRSGKRADMRVGQKRVLRGGIVLEGLFYAVTPQGFICTDEHLTESYERPQKVRKVLMSKRLNSAVDRFNARFEMPGARRAK